MAPWSLDTLLLCFGGGIVGAALGGLFSFGICGLIVLAGCFVILNGGSEFLLMQVGLGPLFGPHTGGFAAGVAAVAYAAGVKKNLASGTGKDILSPLVGTSWDVLLVGGIFAVIGHMLLQLLVRIPLINSADCIALSVVGTACLARLLFCKELPWGNITSIREHGFLGTNDGALSWVPWMAQPGRLIVFSFGVGLLSAAMAMGTKNVLDPMVVEGTVSATGAFVVPLIFAWGIAAISLFGLELGTGEVQKFPVWHCQAILAALAFLLFNSLFLAAIVGVLAGLLQELVARMMWNHGSTHIDPPAGAIAVGTLVLNLAHGFIK
ncbi:MAG: hypothetical protein PWP34_959 [Desulfuromonadales bacterium]|jgi:hypothetical protein|nr:hypothetical protein [Desulfuromonadales bacterium]